MRTENSIKNISISMFSQIITILLGFISRKVFLNNLGVDYLGINGLLTNIISMLGLVQGGVGTSIVYNLYKPLAEKNEEKVIALIQLYKKIYRILALIVLGLSVLIYPIAITLVNRDTNVSNTSIIYFMFVINTIISYLNAHRWSLINADQKGYILVKYNLIFSITTTISKIIILMLTQNYILYLVIEGVIYIVQNMWNGRVVEKHYPYIKKRNKYNIDNATKENLITNVKAVCLHNIGGFCVFGTDNLLISILINVKIVGLYSNYTMIIGQLSDLVNPILSGISESVGNLIATESKEKNYEVFNVVYLINFWLFSFCTIFLYNLLEPFITWFLGEGLLVGKLTFLVVLLNFYLKGMRSSVSIFKSKAGIFSQDRFVPLLEAAVNLGSSILLAKHFGLAGIFLGTTVSTLAFPFWTFPTLVYKNLFNKSVKEYFRKYFMYFGLTIFTGYITTIICRIVPGIGFFSLTLKGIICVAIPNLIYLGLFFKVDEFKYILAILKQIVYKNQLRVFLKQDSERA